MTYATSDSLLQQNVKAFLNTKLAPYSDQYNEDGIFPEKQFREFFRAGFGSSFFPSDWGGDGDLRNYLQTASEMGRVDCGFALSVMASAVLFGKNVLLHGTPEQKERYLPGIAEGSKIGCWGLTEPSTGSDAVSIKTTAEKVSDQEFVLNGSKTFITNAPVADYFIVITRLKGTESQGIDGGCAFILERGMSGLSTGKPFMKMGHRTSPTGEIFLENCPVHKSQLLGTEGKAFYDMKQSLDFERMSFSGIGIGLIDELLKIMVHYGAQRKQFGRPLLDYQLIQDKIAVIGAEFEALKVYCNSVLPKVIEGKSITREAAIVKYLLAKLAVKAADEAIQILGGYGYMTEYRVERFYRDAKLYEIGGGTNEIQKLIIAKEITKEYLRQTL